MSHRTDFRSLFLALLVFGCGTSSPSPVGPVRVESSATAREIAPAPAFPAYCPAPLEKALASRNQCMTGDGCGRDPEVLPVIGAAK